MNNSHDIILIRSMRFLRKKLEEYKSKCVLNLNIEMVKPFTVLANALYNYYTNFKLDGNVLVLESLE